MYVAQGCNWIPALETEASSLASTHLVLQVSPIVFGSATVVTRGRVETDKCQVTLYWRDCEVSNVNFSITGITNIAANNISLFLLLQWKQTAVLRANK